MNTKQLWTALTLNSKTNNFFDGIFSYDTLVNIKLKPTLLICNTDPSYKPGKHWVLFFFKKNEVDFYDSMGKDISFYGTEFLSLVEKFGLKYNMCNIRTQPVNTSLCGVYCLYYAYLKCSKDYEMETIVNKMTNPDYVLKVVEEQFFNSPFYDCNMLQTCLKY